MALILVVDDDVDLSEMIDLTLTANGFKTICISGGKNLFATVSSIKPDLILLDIFLGDSDGRNLCRDLKTQPHYQNIPVILYSAGHVSNGSIQESLADIFIAKPFDTIQLIQQIRTLIK
jgi:DNA-binding response OmpR family regulator